MTLRAGWLIVVGALLGACGDNAATEQCGDGTTLDPTGALCIPDATVCPDGTVLIDSRCQDPAAAHVDLEEGPEDNGFGTAGAGDVVLPAVDRGYVIHGCIAPVGDLADIDDFHIHVAAPTLVDVAVSGVGGLAGGFLATDAGTWRRYGVSVASTLAQRQVYFPAAGDYHLGIADTRSLLPLASGGGLAAAGDPAGHSCYYVTLTVRTPAPAPLAPDATGTLSGGKLAFFAAEPGTLLAQGLNAITLDASAEPRALAAVVTQVGAAAGVDHAAALYGDHVDASVGGVAPTDRTLVVADYVIDTSPSPDLAFHLTVTGEDALPLATAGDAVHAVSLPAPAPGDPRHAADNQFYFDIGAPDTIIGLDLAFDRPVRGDLYDTNGALVSRFTFGPFATFAHYRGLVRLARPGRYYFAVQLPRDAAGTAFTATSRLAPLAPAPIALGTPLAGQVPTPFGATPYTLAASSPWDRFDATATNAGEVVVTVLDPAAAYGRLDTLAVDTAPATGSGSAPSYRAPDPLVIAPLFTGGGSPGCPPAVQGCSFVFPADGSGPVPVVVAHEARPSYLVKVNLTGATGAPTFGLDFAARTFTDLGDLGTAARTVTKSGETVAAGAAHRYFFRGTPYGRATLTLTPHLGSAAHLATLDELEGELEGATATPVAPATLALVLPPEGFVAFQVDGPLAATYDLALDYAPAYYTVHPATTPWVDACTAGATPIAFRDDGMTTFGANDEGLSAPIATPAGWTFFGTAQPALVVSTNGFVSFDPAIAAAHAYPAPLPDGEGEVGIAPYWADLFAVRGCTKQVGTTLVVQLAGRDFISGDLVQTQVRLDGATGAIELLYGPETTADGTNAVAGVQTRDGGDAVVVGNFTPFVTPGGYRLTHP